MKKQKQTNLNPLTPYPHNILLWSWTGASSILMYVFIHVFHIKYRICINIIKAFKQATDLSFTWFGGYKQDWSIIPHVTCCHILKYLCARSYVCTICSSVSQWKTSMSRNHLFPDLGQGMLDLRERDSSKSPFPPALGMCVSQDTWITEHFYQIFLKILLLCVQGL